MFVYILGKKKFTSNAKRKKKTKKKPKILRPRSNIWRRASQNTFLEESICSTFKSFYSRSIADLYNER